MRLGISNLAWDPADDVSIAKMLTCHQIDAIDVAPGKYFPDLGAASDISLLAVKTWWNDRGIEITGMQSLLYGTKGFNIFGEPEMQARMLDHLRMVCRIGNGLGATRLVFGSPKNRDRSGLDDRSANELAVRFFSKLGAIASDFGVCICLEPNPPRYGANFMMTTAEAADIVSKTGDPAIRLQLDSGAMAINNEAYGPILEEYASLIGHVHLSEPDLLPIGNGATGHLDFSKTLKQHRPEGLVTIEMLSLPQLQGYQWIEQAIIFAKQNYLE